VGGFGLDYVIQMVLEKKKAMLLSLKGYNERDLQKEEVEEGEGDRGIK